MTGKIRYTIIDNNDNTPTEADVPLPFETAVVENETYGVIDYSNLAFYDQVVAFENNMDRGTSVSHAEFECFFDIVKFIGKNNFKIAKSPVVMYNGQTIEIVTYKFDELADIDRFFSEQIAGHRTIYLLSFQKMKTVVSGSWDGNFKPIDPAEQAETVNRISFKLRCKSVY